jgi:hypothetical protein
MSKEHEELVRRVFAELAAGAANQRCRPPLNDAVLAEFLYPKVEYVPVAQSLLAVDSHHSFEAPADSGRKFLSTWDTFAHEALRSRDEAFKAAGLGA